MEDLIKEWYRKEQNRIFVISGYAGCGKTYTAKKIPKMLEIKKYAFLAPTGKAATVLAGSAKTVHSFLYEVSTHPDGTLIFTKKPRYKFEEHLIIIDEISMVNQKILRDVVDLGIPIVGLGDPAQLPPIQGTSTILEKPDIFLTKVYRNDGGILELSKNVREMQKGFERKEYENVEFNDNLLEDFDKLDTKTMIICRFNKTRSSLNRLARDKYKMRGLISIGEKIINLKNNYETGLMNGSIVTVKEIVYINNEDDIATIKVETNSGLKQKIEIDLDILKGTFRQVKRYPKKPGIHEVDYAYAITCHKAQGSQFKKVMVVNEGKQFDDHHKWLYTAITRTQEKLYIYKGVL